MKKNKLKTKAGNTGFKGKWKSKRTELTWGGILGIILLVILSYGWANYQAQVKTLPGLELNGTRLGDMTQEEIQLIIVNMTEEYAKKWPMKVMTEDEVWEMEYGHETLRIDPEATVLGIFQERESLSGWEKWRYYWLRERHEIRPVVKINEKWFEGLSASIAARVNRERLEPELEIIASASGQLVRAKPGADGEELNKMAWREQLIRKVELFEEIEADLPIEVVEVGINESEVERALKQAEGLLDRRLTLVARQEVTDQSWSMEGEELVKMVGFKNNFDRQVIEQKLASIAAEINRQATNAEFEIDDDSGRVVRFAYEKPGLELAVQTSATKVIEVLGQMSDLGQDRETELVIVEAQPELALKDLNDLGIDTLLGKGESTYLGSIATRVHNVGLATERINGYIVKPGEVFSFNETVGEISGATGYQAAYVIMNGRTELGDGGGVCQDSTTVFRAALDAGLPITERRAHSYRVGYYEQNAKPGLDATVYAPTTDFKFLNDTPGHLLIWATANDTARHLTIEIYGTDDGRQARIENHSVWDISPPPPDEYIDDPTKPMGELVQVDWSAGGAKAKFDYVVERNGEVIIQDTYYSTYRPWSAKFLRGAKVD